MKPILLKLSGLQSYREPQEIDFETLCETGLFGIFGPTGSGKSTLLDAITLAMYGKVERAVNGTQGIMNHSEDSLSVSFTFELSSAAGLERYRVERRFKRVNELSISNTVSRFIQVTPDGDQVMADKLAEVTRCVEEKIGLKMDDFTRAVVLPQGKFAEFLSLKGSERRQMLQRLFHLERYGDQLAIKLSRRVKDTEGSLKSVEAEQQGLGSAGKEALAEATTVLEDAKKHAASSRNLLQAAIEAHEAMGKIRELDMEKRRLQGKLDELALHEEEMKQLERRLELTGAAAAVLPALEVWRESGKAWEYRRQIAEGLTAQAASAQNAAEQAVKADEAAQAALRAEEPKLVLREQQLEQAVLLQRERDGLREELIRLDAQRVDARKELDGVTAQLQKEQELLERGQKRQEELQTKLKGLEIRSGERQALHMAMQKVQALESAGRRKQKAELELKSQESKLKEQEASLIALQKQEQELQRNYIQLSVQADSLQRDAAEASSFADRMAAAAAQVNQAMSDSLRNKQLHALSLSLAAELREGDPCPVCGSEHHPQPAASSGHPEDHLDETLNQLVQIIHQIQEARLTLRGQLNEAEALASQTRSQIEPYADDELLAVKLAGQEQQGWMEAAVSTIPAADKTYDVEKLASDTAWLIKAAETQAAAIGQCRKEASKVQQSLSTCRQELMKQSAALENGQMTWNQLRDQLEGLEAEAEGILTSWQEVKPDFSLEEAAGRFQLMQEKDAEAESIKEGLERSVPFIEEKKQAVLRLEQQLRELEKQLIQWDAQREGKADGLKDKVERLRAWIGDRSAEELLGECRTRATLLKEAAEQARSECRKAEEKAQHAAKEAALAEQAERSAQEQHQAAKLDWVNQLAASPFATELAVLEACLSAEESERCAQLVKAHREGQREWTLRLRDVEQKLGASPFHEEEWERCTAELQAARTADEEALQARARAERDLEDLNKRHIRFMELEEQRLNLQRESERLSKLQSCLRGNAFVEYIAEEQLMQVSQSASQRLRYLTKQRYSLEVDSGGGFVIRDDANGGVRRPVSTLSGGETFLTSLALALALSAQIQLRGQYPLQFFFLDEGFGTLDPELLETVITALERLHTDKLTVGIISHVPELRARLPRKLVVRPAEQAGAGSQLAIESM
ncbi:chromosome segregation protein SMC [Paenibacillus sp. LC231]|uniref:AAA family ATPase n=1 Tax=Paenibacillus sp. LC231 TaxID=1120679 RepID=UPI0008DCA74F|nr:AAA family ATPase [Paenibacillus sp. LC231]OIA99910.1 chromosome segregation protein SMC [Paenibacillus sp. LC231]